MSDDIVTRLRMIVSGLYDDETGEVIPCPSCVEAADEIERLRTDLDCWRDLAERAIDLLEKANANRVLEQIQEGLNNG